MIWKRVHWGKRVRIRLFAVCLFAIIIGIYVFWNVPAPTAQHSRPVFPQRTSGGYVTSETCQSCHPDQHASWYASYHRTMTQPASEQTVLASFDNVDIATAGQSAKLTRRGDEFWVNIVDPAWEQAMFQKWNPSQDLSEDPFQQFAGDPPRIDARVVMVTGSHHFQVYWIRGKEDPELWQLPWRYHLAEQRWVHRKDVFLAPPTWRPGMWFRVWNDQCSLCHSTGPHPGRDPQTGKLQNTQIAELGIACESCHGPGEGHVAFHSGNVASEAELRDVIVNPAELPSQRSAEVCGACHSHFQHNDPLVTLHGPKFRPGDNLHHFGTLIDPPAGPVVMSRFWGDGVNRSGGREFSGMSTSTCFTEGGMTCLHCHSMHDSDPNDQLSIRGQSNEACLQCHEAMRDNLTAHTHHAADSSGSQCYNCHMPHTNYALFKAIRSHHIDSPTISPLTANARPNACNLCHLDQTLQWSADHLRQWYGRESWIFSQNERDLSAAALWLLRGDAGQRVIAAWHFGWVTAREVSGSDWMAPLLAVLLEDPYAAVRWVAFDAIRKEPAYRQLSYDFDGTAESWAAAAQQLLQSWKSLPKSERLNDAHARLLLEPSGESNEQRLRQLLQQRDDRPLAGVE